jgi:hypothetical protein
VANWTPWLIAPLLITTVGVGTKIGDQRDTLNPPVKPAGLNAHDSHAAASLLGQFRTSLSSWLYLHADLYLHNGVEMRPLSDAELAAGRKGVGNSEANKAQLHNDAKIVTVVPGKTEDFRGVFGDAERAVASYKDMKGHGHNSPTSTLPLFRLMTWLDPQFTPGWSTGAFALLWDRKPGCIEKSNALLKEGLTHNPKSIELTSKLAHNYLLLMPELNKDRDYKSALTYCIQARAIVNENWTRLSEEEKEAALENYRRLTVCYRENGLYKHMAAAAYEGLQKFPDDGPLQRMLDMAQIILKGEKPMMQVSESSMTVPKLVPMPLVAPQEEDELGLAGSGDEH